ncbi:hypothetical protein PanWU01x14_056500, partial [Parasponia andersonii]
ALAAGPSDQNQPLSEYDDILRILEEDAEAEELNNFACGPNIDEVHRYCKWLQKNQH